MISAESTRLILFDLDGTLVDSAPDLAWCGDEMMRLLGLPQPGIALARNWVGNGIERFVKRVLTNDMVAEPETKLYQQGLSMFDQLYTDNICNRSQLYPGVLEGLKRLQQTGIELACVTNKAAHFTEVLIDEIGLGSFFQLVVSGDTTARLKPDPMPLQYAADYFAFRSTDCLMVGDSSNDVEAARNANFKVACVPYGYNHGEDIRISEPDLVVNSIDELADLFVINAKPGSAVSC